jgi:transcriptional accessory protein Tex/SPT6
MATVMEVDLARKRIAHSLKTKGDPEEAEGQAGLAGGRDSRDQRPKNAGNGRDVRRFQDATAVAVTRQPRRRAPELARLGAAEEELSSIIANGIISTQRPSPVRRQE